MTTTPDPLGRRLPMFSCLRCGEFTRLPRCHLCDYEFETVGGIYQLTRDPGSNLDGEVGVTYIGYDRIGAYYHGRSWTEGACEARDMVVGKEVLVILQKGAT